MMRFPHPAFTTIPVTSFTTGLLLVLVTTLVYIRHTVPTYTRDVSRWPTIDIEEAWQDLRLLTAGYHSYNSHENDKVRAWLLSRIHTILECDDLSHDCSAPAMVYDDLTSNTSFYQPARQASVYFEGTNLIVYVPGSEPEYPVVLVNAHFDSVSTAYGATDDGVGIVTILQLIRYYTTSGNTPKRGFLALLNNGEEDYLNGAWAFLEHPSSQLPDTFVNLEGVGAGGRAALFRSTDAEVTRSYQSVPYPFGSVLSADGFDKGLVKSQTDYIVFKAIGMRGLDIAFLEPRSRYHTSEDSTETTSRGSLWHMLSAALAITISLTDDVTTDYRNGKRSDGVWFDVLGQKFILMSVQSVFATSLVSLVCCPLILAWTTFALLRADKLGYLYDSVSFQTSSTQPSWLPNQVRTLLTALSWRAPVAFTCATVCVSLLAFWIASMNPFIIYRSEYVIWMSMLSMSYLILWTSLRVAHYLRPSVFQRAHTLGWLFLFSWIALVVEASYQRKYGLGGGYFMVVYFVTTFMALMMSCLELFALPTYAEYQINSGTDGANRPNAVDFQSGLVVDGDVTDHQQTRPDRSESGIQATESTPLMMRHYNESPPGRLPRILVRLQDFISKLRAHAVTGHFWSAHLPSWSWLLQHLITVPVITIFVGQAGMLTTLGLHQTLSDGGDVLYLYLLVALFSMLILLPITPYIHKVHYCVSVVLFWILIGTLVYSLTSHPFSPQSKMTVFFSQSVNLDSGDHYVSLTGLDGYIQQVTDSIPSTAGKTVNCSASSAFSGGLVECTWPGLLPPTMKVPATGSDSWVSIKAARVEGDAKRRTPGAVFEVFGQNTRACKIQFGEPIDNFHVRDSGPLHRRNDRDPTPDGGTKEIRLWSREWNRTWTVDVEWLVDNTTTSKDAAGRGKKGGRAVCAWNNVNEAGTIPSFDEVFMYMPSWSAVTKLGDGLLEASVAFEI